MTRLAEKANNIRGIWVFEDGKEFQLTGVSGGASPCGLFGEIMCELKMPDGTVYVMSYELMDKHA